MEEGAKPEHFQNTVGGARQLGGLCGAEVENMLLHFPHYKSSSDS